MRFFAFVFLLILPACGGSSGSSLIGNASSGGPDAASSVDASDGSPGNPLATGTCAFTIDGAAVSLPGFAAMNGSGNLQVRCADATRTFDLDVGNGTYEGPGSYAFSSQLNKGSMDFETSTHVYRVGSGTGGPATTCAVVITEAPPSNYAPKGSDIKGTITCTAALRFPKDEKGRAARESDGTFDLTGGSFALKAQ
jgi:hypothetical protein